MKKVIFLCLLSLSVCLSKPADEKVSPVSNASTTVDPKITKPTETISSQATQTTLAPTVKENATEHQELKPSPSSPPKPESTNKTSDKPAKEEEIKPAAANETKVVPTIPNKDVKPAEEKPKNETTTEKGPMKTTETPKVTETPKPDMHIVEKARGFDGPSFFGGIVLTLGLLAIGFMGFKYYKNQTERNYHTL
ncbi:unnamed protein product, partial [Brenthis ino]